MSLHFGLLEKFDLCSLRKCGSSSHSFCTKQNKKDTSSKCFLKKKWLSILACFDSNCN